MCPTYNPNIPQPADKISVSQNALLENFQQLNTAFGIDHLNYNDGNQGKHTVVNLSVQAGDPVTPLNFLALYSKGYNLYTQSPGGTAEKISGWTATAASPGKIVFPNGITIIWGSGMSTGALTDKPFALGGFPNNCWTIIASNTNNQAGLLTGSVTLHTLVVDKTNYRDGYVYYGADVGNIFYNYIAIGN